jgi:hypothetical protein
LFGLANDREPGLFAAPFVREAGLKNRCDAGGALRTADGLAKRPDGLKLSREGVTGILPVIRLAFRNDTSLIGCWCHDTAPRPNSLPPIELMPERTRGFDSAPFRFEYRCARSPPRGPKPS